MIDTIRRTSVRTLTQLAAAGGCLLVVTAATACQDAASDPLALVMTQETRGALSLDVALPSLPELATRNHGGDGGSSMPPRVDEWIGAWQASWLAPEPEARELRESVYAEVVPSLVRTLGPQGLRATVDDVRHAVDVVAGAEVAGLPTAYQEHVTEARSRAYDAVRHLDAGRDREALRSALVAGDLLRSVSPGTVAETLVERAEEGHGRIPEVTTYSRRERDRIARLIRNARSAIEAGEYALAIQRAYYACRLLGLELE